MRSAIFFIAALLLQPAARAAEKGKTPKPAPSRSFTLDGAISVGLQQNPDILKSVHEIERTRGQIIEVRAQAIPRLAAASQYNQLDPKLLEVQGGFQGGAGAGGGFVVLQDKSWRITFEARQLVYAGGQVKAALKIAQLTEDTSHHLLRETVDRVVANIRTQFYTILLNRELITVAEETIQLLTDELTDQQNRFAAGTVPRFNVLRAEVELANARPTLIRARNNHLISRLELAKTLGFDAGHGVDSIGELRAIPREFSLARALAAARERRALLKAQKNTISSEEEQIKLAAAGYKPRMEVSAGYELRNSRLTQDLTQETNGWYIGATGSWNIFDGLETKGKIDQAKARVASAKVSFADSVQQVELEVQKAFARVNEARELIESQGKVVEQAEEALRLAKERLAAGAGTQLDVLDTRVALTRARTTEKQALFDYNVAIAELDRSTGAETIHDQTFPNPATARSKAALRSGATPLRPAD